jgi:hypothetical protein
MVVARIRSVRLVTRMRSCQRDMCGWQDWEARMVQVQDWQVNSVEGGEAYEALQCGRIWTKVVWARQWDDV